MKESLVRLKAFNLFDQTESFVYLVYVLDILPTCVSVVVAAVPLALALFHRLSPLDIRYYEMRDRDVKSRYRKENKANSICLGVLFR